MGAFERAREMMDENILSFNGLGVRKIVTLCAGCYHTLKKDYLEAASPLIPEVYHMVEITASLIESGRLNTRSVNSLKVAYHDPCHLGRHMGVFDPPRRILDALPGVELVERTATRENTICCGAGGGLRLFEGGRLAEQIGKESLLSAGDGGADALVTACPFCEMNLKAAARQLDSGFPVYDVVDLVSASLGIS